MIAELKSIGSPIGRSVMLAGVSGLSSLPMLDGENGKNVVVFDLVPKDEDFPFDGVLLFCHRLDKDCVVVEATEFARQGNWCFS